MIQWNTSIDHEIGWNTLVRATYTGSHTYKLIYSPDLNQVAPNTVGYAALTATPALRQFNLRYPNFREVLTRDNGPSAKYDALTGELNRRCTNNLTFQNNYRSPMRLAPFLHPPFRPEAREITATTWKTTTTFRPAAATRITHGAIVSSAPSSATCRLAAASDMAEA